MQQEVRRRRKTFPTDDQQQVSDRDRHRGGQQDPDGAAGGEAEQSEQIKSQRQVTQAEGAHIGQPRRVPHRNAEHRRPERRCRDEHRRDQQEYPGQRGNDPGAPATQPAPGGRRVAGQLVILANASLRDDRM
jgi:hypothetical protein